MIFHPDCSGIPLRSAEAVNYLLEIYKKRTCDSMKLVAKSVDVWQLRR